MEIGTTIRTLRKERGLTLNQMATLIDSDVGNLSRLERGVQGYSEATLKKIAEVLGVPVAALFLEVEHVTPLSNGGTATPDNLIVVQSNENTRKNLLERMQGNFRGVYAADQDDPNFVQIPMVQLRLQAGVTGFQTEPDRRDGGMIGMRRNWVERNGYDSSKLIAVQVKGESMEPGLYDRDVVVINTADTRPVDGVVYAINYEGEAVIKRMSRDAGMWWLTSDNPDQRKYHRKSVAGNECIIIGRVVRKESDRI